MHSIDSRNNAAYNYFLFGIGHRSCIRRVFAMVTVLATTDGGKGSSTANMLLSKAQL